MLRLFKASRGEFFAPQMAAGVLMAALALPSPALSQPKTIDEIANYTGADRQAMLEAGARKEGTVLIYTPGTQTKPLRELFRKKYPYVDLKVYQGSSSTMVRRGLEEYKAGRFIADGFAIGTGYLRILMENNVLRPYRTPLSKKYKKEAIGPKNHWIITRESYLGLGFNTKETKAADLPQTYEDLIKPKFKGKLAISGRKGTLNHWVGMLQMAMGDKYLGKLANQNWTVHSISGKAFSNLIVAGEIPFGPAVYNSHMANSKSKGANVGWKSLGPVFSTVAGVGLARNAPSPHAALLYADIYNSKEGQRMMQSFGYASARLDMTNPDKPNGKIYYLTERDDYSQKYIEWGKIAKKVFAKAKKVKGKKKKKKK
jgi:iron(III) transport system substrate-binding protein